MPEEQKSFYDVRKWGDRLKTGEELSISHNLYFNSHHADLRKRNRRFSKSCALPSANGRCRVRRPSYSARRWNM